MNQEEILALAGEILTSKTHGVNVPFPEHIKTYRISPVLVGNRYRISAIANKVPRDLHVDDAFNNYKVWKAITEHTESLLMATAICIQNREKEPSQGFLNKLKDMIGSEGVMFNDLFKSLEQPGVSDFYKMYKLDKRPKCTECAGAGGDCETCKGTGYRKEESESRLIKNVVKFLNLHASRHLKCYLLLSRRQISH